MGIYIKNNLNLSLSIYCDADLGACKLDCKSTTGYAIFAGSNLVSRSSKKQHAVSHSSTEAEYRALVMSTSEVLWLISIL